MVNMRDWYDVRVASPTVSGWYDIMTPHGTMACVWYSTTNGGWNQLDGKARIESLLEVYAWAVRESEHEILEKLRRR